MAVSNGWLGLPQCWCEKAESKDLHEFLNIAEPCFPIVRSPFQQLSCPMVQETNKFCARQSSNVSNNSNNSNNSVLNSNGAFHCHSQEINLVMDQGGGAPAAAQKKTKKFPAGTGESILLCDEKYPEEWCVANEVFLQETAAGMCKAYLYILHGSRQKTESHSKL